MATSGISLVNNLSANTAQLNLNRNQNSLATATQRLSSGLRINTAADDPSGLAISESLQAQVNGFDAAVANVQDATNAAAVAEGALQTTTDILQRVRTLAVQAASDINSTSDKTNLQQEVTQLLLEVNRISQNTTFNGLQLLDGSHAGYQAAQIAGITITSNSALASTGAGLQGGVNYGLLAACVVPSTSATNPSSLGNITGFFSTGYNGLTGAQYAQGFTTGTLSAGGTVDGTIELQVVNTGLSIAVIESFFNSGIDPTSTSTLATVTAGAGLIAGNYTVTNPVSVAGQLLAANSTYTVFDNVTITLGAFGTNDVGVVSYIKINQQTAVASNPTQPAFNFQSGSNEGQTIQVGLAATNTNTLRISNINLLASTPQNPSLGAEDAIGQIDHALDSLLTQRAALGAVIVRLNEDANNDTTAAVNLQASESNIRDLNVSKESTQFNRLTTLVQVGTSILAQANLQPSSVQTLFR